MNVTVFFVSHSWSQLKHNNSHGVALSIIHSELHLGHAFLLLLSLASLLSCDICSRSIRRDRSFVLFALNCNGSTFSYFNCDMRLPRQRYHYDPEGWHNEKFGSLDDIDYWSPPGNHWLIPLDELRAMRDAAFREGFHKFPYHYFGDLMDFVLYKIEGSTLFIRDFSGLGPEAVEYVFNHEDPSRASAEMAALYQDVINYSVDPEGHEQAIAQRDYEQEMADIKEALPELHRQVLYDQAQRSAEAYRRAREILERNERDRIEFMLAENFIRANLHLFK